MINGLVSVLILNDNGQETLEDRHEEETLPVDSRQSECELQAAFPDVFSNWYSEARCLPRAKGFVFFTCI